MAGEWYLSTDNFKRLEPYLAADAPGPNGWWDAYCPLHSDDKRSAGFDFENGQWSCRTGCGGGSIDALIDLLDRDDFRAEEAVTGGFVDDAEIINLDSKRRQKRQKGSVKPPPSEDDIEHWAQSLQDNLDALEKFQAKRGISVETLAKFQVGWDDGAGAYTIPIRDADGQLINLRLYNPDRAKTKIWSWGSAGMDPNAVYPMSQLEHDELVICEGEFDALIAIDKGFNAVTGTTGAWQWMAKWNRLFDGKDVTIVYDRDKTGVNSSEKVARNLAGVARTVRIAELPLPYTEKHGQDVTDFFVTHGLRVDEFKSVLRNARLHTAPKDGDIVNVTVRESYNPDLSGAPMGMTVSVVGKGTQVHLIPKEVVYSCNMNAGPKCHGCPMEDAGGLMEASIKPEHDVVLALRDVPTSKRDDALREYMGIHKCGKMEIDVKSFTTTEVLVVRASIDEVDDEDDHRARTVINVGGYRTDPNQVVKITGTVHNSPGIQESVFQAWDVAPVESSLDRYETTKSDIELMKLFRPARNQPPMKKIGEIARDMADNVTRIYERSEVHIAMDLVWHSVLGFVFDGQPIEKGWLDLLVIGDARTGKSEIAHKLSKFYGFGRMISCESASIPGLLGAVKPMPGASKSWTLEWGAIPLNDRRLVILDEAGGLTVEQIGQLSSLRSSGVAEIIKAEREQTHARTRLIWLSNPRNNRHGMAGSVYGISAIGPLIGSQEDIARFDFATSLNADDVPIDRINRHQVATAPHRHTSEACHALVRWVWSRQRDQVVWQPEAEDEVYKQALRLGTEYVPDPPLIQGQNVRVKIARLAAAVAARTFSTDAKCDCIIIKKEHVTGAVKFLDHLYGMDSFGYKETSKRVKEKQTEAVASMDEIKEYLYSRPGLARLLIDCGGTFRRQQLEDQLNYGADEAKTVIQRLSSTGMIESDSWDYRIMPIMNSILRDAKDY